MQLRNYPEFNDNLSIVWSAIRQNGFALQYASEEFQTDKHFITEANANIEKAVNNVHEDIKRRTNPDEMQEYLVQLSGDMFQEIIKHKDICDTILKVYPDFSIFLTDDLP